MNQTDESRITPSPVSYGASASRSSATSFGRIASPCSPAKRSASPAGPSARLISFRRFDRPFLLGRDLEEAIEINLALGPAGEALRFAGEQGEAMRPKLVALLREALAPYDTGEGVILDSSVWFITASVPTAG